MNKSHSDERHECGLTQASYSWPVEPGTRERHPQARVHEARQGQNGDEIVMMFHHHRNFGHYRDGRHGDSLPATGSRRRMKAAAAVATKQRFWDLSRNSRITGAQGANVIFVISP